MISFIETVTFYGLRYFIPIVIMFMILCGLACIYMIIGTLFGFIKSNVRAR
jgi:hypothetical protein